MSKAVYNLAIVVGLVTLFLGIPKAYAEPETNTFPYVQEHLLPVHLNGEGAEYSLVHQDLRTLPFAFTYAKLVGLPLNLAFALVGVAGGRVQWDAVLRMNEYFLGVAFGVASLAKAVTIYERPRLIFESVADIEPVEIRKHPLRLANAPTVEMTDRRLRAVLNEVSRNRPIFDSEGNQVSVERINLDGTWSENGKKFFADSGTVQLRRTDLSSETYTVRFESLSCRGIFKRLLY